MLPFGARAGNLYIGRTQYGSRPVINITPGPFRGPRGRRKAAGRHPWIPYGVRYIYWLESAKRNRAVPGRSPEGELVQPAGSFTGCLRATGLNKTPGELGAASSTHRRPYGFLKLSRRPWNRKGDGRAPYGNGQNIHFYSPYGAREWFVKAPLTIIRNSSVNSQHSHTNTWAIKLATSTDTLLYI